MAARHPKWRNFLINVGWYLATLLALVVLLRFSRVAFVLVVLWLVGLGWGGVLAYQFSQLITADGEQEIREERLQRYLEQALSYRERIHAALKTGPARQSQPEQLRDQLDSWVEAIEKLVHSLNTMHQDKLIYQDLKEVPQAIAELESRLADEDNPALQAQLEHALANRHKQLAALEQLQDTISRAEIQIDSTLSMLGTIYSQILTGQSTSHVADYSRLSTEVDEEVRLLQDHLEALREVRLGAE